MDGQARVLLLFFSSLPLLTLSHSLSGSMAHPSLTHHAPTSPSQDWPRAQNLVLVLLTELNFTLFFEARFHYVSPASLKLGVYYHICFFFFFFFFFKIGSDWLPTWRSSCLILSGANRPAIPGNQPSSKTAFAPASDYFLHLL